MAHKVSAGGSYRLDKVFPAPVGRLALASGSTTKAAYENVVACLKRLAERGRLDVLVAIKQHRVTIAGVLNADRTGTLDALLESLSAPPPPPPTPESAPLWDAVEEFLGPKKLRSHTVRRYGVSLKKLQGLGVLPPDATVEALAAVNWIALSRRWTGEKGYSPSDWMALKRAVSRFLTVHLGDEHHRLRLAVVPKEKFPKKKERERVPDLDVPSFWRIVNAAPEYVRPAFVAIVALGLRTGEFLRLRAEHLHPITKSISVPGTKTEGSAAVLPVAPELWSWIVAAVPSPLSYWSLRYRWKEAIKATGADPTLRLHDLRHLPAQLLADAGMSEASIQTTMRHATASMTRRYSQMTDKGRNAGVLGGLLLEAKSA